MHADGVFWREERVLVLAGGVDDGDIVLDALVGDLLEVGCLHGRVIWLDELVVDELDDERRLACAACLSPADRIREGGAVVGTDRRLWSRAHRFCASS